MSRSGISHRLVFSIVLVSMIAACGDDSVDTPAGVRLVRDTLPNGSLLLRYGALPAPPAEALSSDLRIGVLEGDASDVFGDVRAIEADEDGTIYVLDHQASEVRAFDSDGRFLRTLTRRGQGPGELTAANGMVLADDSILWIQDHGQWHFIAVNLHGEEVARLPMHVRSYGYIWDGALDDRGRLWKATTHSDEPPRFPPEPGFMERRARSYMKWLDPEDQATDSVFLGDVTHRMHITRTSAGAWMNRGIPFSSEPIELVDPRGGFWMTAGDAYRIARLDQRGDTVFVLEVDEAPEPVTGADRQRYIESMLERSPDQRRALEELVGQSAAAKPVIDQLILDDEGRLWVRRRVVEDDDVRYDVFEREGEYVGSVRLGFRPAPYFPPRIRNGNLYAVATDSLGVQSVVRASVPPLSAQN